MINKCIVCGEKDNNIFYTNKNSTSYFMCDNCGYIFIDGNALQISYPKNALKNKSKYFENFRDYRSNKNWIWAISDALWISKYVNPEKYNNPQALSVGCAYAHDLNELRKVGWNVTGLDHDIDFAERAKRQHNIDVITDSFEKHDFESELNLVMFVGVIPYIHEIQEAIKKTYDILGNDGYLMINSRSVDFSQGKGVLSYPTNVYARQYFSEKSMRIFLSKLGFEVVSIDSFKLKNTIMDKVPHKIIEFNIGMGSYKISPLLELFNIFYVIRRLFKFEAYKSEIRIKSDTLRILAKKINQQ